MDIKNDGFFLNVSPFKYGVILGLQPLVFGGVAIASCFPVGFPVVFSSFQVALQGVVQRSGREASKRPTEVARNDKNGGEVVRRGPGADPSTWNCRVVKGGGRSKGRGFPNLP